LYNCKSLFTCFLSRQVFIFPQMLSIHFSAFFIHYPRCSTLPVRNLNCRLLQRYFRGVALTPARITDVTLSRMNLAPTAIFCSGIGTHSKQRTKRLNILGLFQTKGKMCAKFGADWFRNVNLYKLQTHTYTNKNLSALYIRFRYISSNI